MQAAINPIILFPPLYSIFPEDNKDAPTNDKTIAAKVTIDFFSLKKTAIVTATHSIARNSKLYYNLYADRRLCCIITGSELTFKWRVPPSAVMPSKIIRWFFLFLFYNYILYVIIITVY